MNIQGAIDRMTSDLVRVRCSKVLLSPEMHQGCLDRMADRHRMIAEFDSLPPITGNVFVRGVPAEKCALLSGAEYALVPKSPDNTITINGIPVDFIPPATDSAEKLVFGVKQSAIDAANQTMDGWQFVEVRRVDGIPVYELRKSPDST